jgi:hypothetical protein
MQSRTWSRVARVAAITCGLVGQAARSEAATIQYTYTGTVGYGYDRAGIFGKAESLTGSEFTLVERFDTARNTYRWVDTAQSLQFGGSTRGVSDSASLSVTIGGVTRNIADLEDYIYSGSVTGKHQDFVKDETGYEYAGFYVQSSFMKADYGAPMSLDAADATFIGNYQYFDATDDRRATYASFDVRNLTVTSSISAVPLPGSLALFGASLLLVAAAPRIRRLRRSKAPQQP